MKKRLLALLLVLMLVVSLLPVGALADGTAEVIGGTYDGIETVEYRIEIAQLYKLLLLYGEGVDDDTKLEGATFEFHEKRGYGDSQALLPITAVDRANFYYYYSFSDVADAGDPYNISGLIIKYDDKETYIDASDLRIRYTGDRLYYVEAKNDEKSVVVFYDNGEATTGSRSDYWVYAVRLADNSETVENWPENPDTITYSFLNWTYSPDGTGSIFLKNSQVNEDIEVFARKVSGNDTVAGTQIHIMNDGNAFLERFVDLYNTKYNEDIQVTDLTESVLSSMKVTVHGQNGNATNPNYYVSNVEHNGWEDGYYLVYNRDGDSIDSGSQLYNKHIPANEITKITIEAKIDGNTVNVEVNRGLAPGEFEVSSSGLDRILNIYFNPIPVATVNYTVNYYYDNAIDADNTETGTGKVGDKIESVTDKPGTGYCLDHSNLPFTLTADETENVITVYYATDANDNDIPDHDETKYGVTYEFVSGTEGKNLPDSGMPTPPSDSTTYLTGITVTNKGDTTYKAVSADDGTWTFTGWDATQKEMVEDGITFTGTWTFTPNEPEPTQYTIYYHGNGGTTGNGSEQSTSTFTYGSNATIKNNPFTYAGYVFEGWSLSAESTDVVYQGGESVVFDDTTFTGLTASGRVDLYATWALDEKGGGDDGESPDGIPDYKQLFVKYASADSKLGSVSPACETFTLEVDEYGKVLTDPVTLSGTAAADENAEFAYWTITGLGYEGGAYSYDADLKSKAFSGYVAGETYTFTAYFTEDIVKPEPETYTIEVEVINGTAEFMGTNIGADNEIVAAAGEDITIAFTPDEGYEFDYVYVDGVWSELGADGKYTFENVSANHSIKVAYKQESVPATPITPLPTEGDIAELIDGKIIVDCVNDDVNHANKNYGLVDDALVKVAMTDGTTVKVTLSANAYLAQYNGDDTSAKHSLADGQSETVTITLKYVDDEWTLPADAGELPATIKVVCETSVTPEPTPDITGFTKELVTDRRVYWNNGIAYPEFYRGDVIVDEGDSVTLIYKLTVTGTEGTEYTFSDADTTLLGAPTGVIGASGKASIYVSKTFSWRTIRNSDTLDNTAYVYLSGEDDPEDGDTVKIDVDIDWDYDPPADDDDDDTVYVPNWLNTTDHYSYIVGYEDGTIRPNNNITRAEVATIFYRLLTDGARETWYSTVNGYNDVAYGSWYNTAISTLSRMGIINGYEDGSFKPDAPITRAEFTAIATRFFDYTARYRGAFNDVASGSWYADYVQAAVDMGLVDGYPDGGFHPNSYITRAETVTIVNRVLHRVPHEDYLLSTRVMNTWPDNLPGTWYYADMQEATNSHDYDWIRVGGSVVEDWTRKLTDPNW